MYNEIQELYEYCKKIGIDANIEPFFDGYKITFPDVASDVVQYKYSYGSEGFVEPAIGSRLDYKTISLKQAKQLIKRHKKRLNKEV